MTDLCFVENDITSDYAEGNPRWVVTLNNGQKVYSFDHHTDKGDSCWIRLKKYCESNSLYITDIYIHFRSNTINFPSNKDGYFFRRGILASLQSEYSQHFMYVGYLENDQLLVKKYQIPAMLLEETEYRDIEVSEESLIRRI